MTEEGSSDFPNLIDTKPLPPQQSGQNTATSGVWGSWLTPLCWLAFPLLALAVFHYVNLAALPPQARAYQGFFALPYRFVTQLKNWQFMLPEGLLMWSARSWLSLLPMALLGYALMGFVTSARLLRCAVAIPLGLGIVGVCYEWLAMAGQLKGITVGLMLVLTVVVALMLLMYQRSRRWSEETWEYEPAPRWWWFAAWAAFGLTTLLNFQHALWYPPNYWDALIYYLYYAKLVFLEGGVPFPVDGNGFPELVQGQVGLGLGANYPHLFLFWQAATCRLFGEWSSYPGQWFPPLAGAGTALCVYGVVLYRNRQQSAALMALVLMACLPYWNWYQHWVSDYPLATWLTAGCVVVLAVSQSRGALALLALAPLVWAGGHLNYLMISLWWFMLVWCVCHRQQLLRPRVVGGVVLSLVITSTWLVRNWWVTGNPVYAFYPEIFGGINIDLDILRSCDVEWTRNGDGLAQVGQNWWQRLLGSPAYFLADPSTSLKWAVLPLGWFLPSLWSWFRGPSGQKDACWWGITGFLGILFFYAYAVSGLYLYHIMPALPLMVIMAGNWLSLLPRPGSGYDRARWFAKARLSAAVVLLATWLTVGIPSSLLGAKWPSTTLYHTLHPGMPAQLFLRASVGPAYEIWQFLNRHMPIQAVLLTHENRHYYLRDDIRLVHLDDYRLIPYYDQSADQVLAKLHQLGVGYYLRIPNERNHPILARLGIDAMLDHYFEPVINVDGQELYRLKPQTSQPTNATEASESD